MGFFESLWAFLVAFCMIFTGIMDYGTASSTKEVELVKEEKMVLDAAMYAGQGITTDGEYYYTSGSLTAFGVAGLAKWDTENFEQVAVNTKAIPEKYVNAHDSDHIGGISYYDGKIYAAVENEAEDFSLVITYDTETLQPVDSYKMPNEYLPDGIPWCAVDADNGYLYCSPFNDVDYIVACDLETMEFSHIIELSETVYRIQGGEVYEGVLYLSNDDESNSDKILTVDISTGEVKRLCTRTLPSVVGNEAEGLTVYPMEDGSFIHVLDYDKTVGVYVRHYKVVV
ncbi:MAG: hypothetical protein J6A49_02345 [Clostridia bacterium]|nr:hypothetical protein [Clostridia bacterium]